MRILYLAHRVPYAPDRGDRIRAHHTLRVLSQMGHEVHLLALAHDDDEERRAGELATVCRSWHIVRVPRARNLLRALAALPSERPLTHVLLDAPGIEARLAELRREVQPELVFAFCSGVAAWLRLPALADLPFVLDLVDVDSAKWHDYAAASRPPMRWIYAREARTLGRFERATAEAALAALVVNDREAKAARALAPSARVVTVGNGVDVDYFGPPAALDRRPDVVFTAVFDYRPNEAGALWLAREVWPTVRRTQPDARLLLVGARPTARVRALASADRGILVTGAVPDVREHLWRAQLAIAPLFLARGTQNKVLEALAAGLPAVVTEAVATGLPPTARAGCVVANDADAFARAILGILGDVEIGRALAARADVGQLTWRSALGGLQQVLEVDRRP